MLPIPLTFRVVDGLHAMMGSNLDPWIEAAKAIKLASFAAGVEADKNAIAAAITEP